MIDRRPHPLAGFDLRQSWVFVGCLLCLVAGLRADPPSTLSFLDGGIARNLTNQAKAFPVYFRGLRPRLSPRGWTVDAVLSNASPNRLVGPVWLGFSDRSAAAQSIVDSVGAGEVRLLEVTPRLPAGGVAPGAVVGLGRVVFGSGTGTPNWRAAVFVPAPNPPADAPLAYTRVLDEFGLPLENVEVLEVGPSAPGVRIVGKGGWISLPRPDGVQGWLFRSPGRLTVFRAAPAEGEPIVGLITVRLPLDSDNSNSGFGPQTLPGLLPRGWSPLMARRFAGGDLEAALEGGATPGKVAILVSWDADVLAWRGVARTSVDAVGRVRFVGAGPGWVAVVIADAGFEPTFRDGELLPGMATGADPVGILAEGRVEPSVRPASRTVAQVVTAATVDFRAADGVLALRSGLNLLCDIRETYVLRDGTRRVLPPYCAHITGFAQPGKPGGLRAVVPLRPTQLLGNEELSEALLRVDVLAPAAPFGGRLGITGGVVTNAGVALRAASGVVTEVQWVELAARSTNELAGVLPMANPILLAVEVNAAGIVPGNSLQLVLPRQAPNQRWVLGRAVFNATFFGFQPVARLASDESGNVQSTEPISTEHLPGIDASGLYLVVGVDSEQGLVTGVARDRLGHAVDGLPVRSGPWLTVTDPAGRYQVVAPAGPGNLYAVDPRTGDTSQVPLTLTDVSRALAVDFAVGQHGPFILGTRPSAGAVDVARVAAVTVTFDKPLAPGPLVAGGAVQLITTAGTNLPVGVSLNLARTTLTVLPAAQLPGNERLTLRLASTLTDTAGLPLEGAREFSFSTESDLGLRTDTGLVIREPGNGLAPMLGGSGVAEPNAPVILVNDTTGVTSTVLSRADGSFSNNIPATVDDFLSVVLINHNGTRNNLPATRQLFRDGSVGLYQGGGVVSASGAGLDVDVTVVPGSIANKTILRLRPVSGTELQAAAESLPPAGGKLLRGFQLETRGDPLREPLRIRQSVSPSEISVTPGAKPEEMAFALVRGVTLDGVDAYEVLDTARFADGHLETEGALAGIRQGIPFGDAATSSVGVSGIRAPGARKSSALSLLPFFSFFFTAVLDSLKESFSVVNGQVQSTEPGAGPGTEQPVAGATVRVGGEEVAGAIFPGSLVAISASNGAFAVPGNRALVARNILVGSATSQQFSGQVAVTRTTYVPGLQRFPLNLFFRRGTGGAAADDRDPPVLSVSHSPAAPAINAPATLRVLAFDDRQIVSVNVAVQRVTALDSSRPVTLSDVTVTQDPGGSQSTQTLQRSYTVRAGKPLSAELLITALDAKGRTSAASYAITFGGPQLPQLGDPGDVTGPFVMTSHPFQGAEGVLPGETIRLQLSEPIRPDFLSNPAAAFQLVPNAGTVVAALRDNNSTIELTWYRLAPGTAYRLTVVPILYDLNGNRFDQNPANNSPSTTGLSADAFGLSFTTAPLTPTVLPTVQNGVGVAAVGRKLVVLDRGGANQGAIQVIDAEDPGHPVLKFSVPVPAFPRAFAVIPKYAYKRSSVATVETNDLIVAAGGTLGGEGQWLRVFTLPASGAPQPLVVTMLSTSPAAAVTKFQWSPPVLGYLESDADTTAVGLLNLQLAILADHQSSSEPARNPVGGDPGIDANGDGDFVDPGDRLPLPDGARPRLGVINGGLLAMYVAPDPVFRLRDFDLRFGGNFVGAVLSAPPSDGRSRYTSLAAGGQPVLNSSATLEFSTEAKRLFLLFGQSLETANGLVAANLALVSQLGGTATPARILVVDVTDPLHPKLVNEIRVPTAHGVPQTLQQREDGLLALSTSSDQLLLDPRKLLQVPALPGDPHPALVGLLAGVGSGMMNFVNSPLPLYAVAAGGNNAVIGLPGSVDLTLHTPGTLGNPGRVIAEAAETDPFNVVVSVNDDDDDAILPVGDTNPASRLPQGHFDNQDETASRFDNDLVRIDLHHLPPSSGGVYDGTVELEVRSPGGTTPAVRVFALDGTLLRGGVTNAAGALSYRTDFQAASGPFLESANHDSAVFMEGLRPCADVGVVLTYRRRDGTVIGTDEVHFVVAKLEITEVWSNQFEGKRDNLLPKLAGDFVGPNSYLVMANRADGNSHVKARIEIKPDLAEIRRQVKLTLLPVDGVAPPDAFVRSHGTSTLEPVAVAPTLDVFRLVAPAISTRHFFVAAGFNYTPGPDLSVDDVVTVFGHKAYLARGELIFSRQGGHLLTHDPHLEIVNQTDYTLTRLEWSAIALASGVAVDSAFAPYNLKAFVLGDLVNMKVPPLFGGVPLEILPESPGTQFIPNSSEHNIGFSYDSSGTPRVATYVIPAIPLYQHFQDKLVNNSRFIAKLATDIRSKKSDVKQSFLATPGQVQSLVFHWNFGGAMDFAEGGGICDFPDATDDSFTTWLSNFASGVATCPEFDLKIALGGCTYKADLTVEVEAVPAPFTAASRLVVKAVFVDGFIADRYDWKYEASLDYPLAVLQAGYGTLGISGRVFEYKAMIQRPVFSVSGFAGALD